MKKIADSTISFTGAGHNLSPFSYSNCAANSALNQTIIGDEPPPKRSAAPAGDQHPNSGTGLLVSPRAGGTSQCRAPLCRPSTSTTVSTSSGRRRSVRLPPASTR